MQMPDLSQAVLAGAAAPEARGAAWSGAGWPASAPKIAAAAAPGCMQALCLRGSDGDMNDAGRQGSRSAQTYTSPVIENNPLGAGPCRRGNLH